MPSSISRALLLFTFAGGLASAAPAVAQEEWLPPPHVRPAPEMRALFDEATGRSPTVRGLVNWLEILDVTVYVRTQDVMPRGLLGRAALLSVNGSHRYIVIDVASQRTAIETISTLGHELFHAIEIAREPSIVDPRTLGEFFERAGRETGDADGRRTFETQAAAATGTRVRRELLAWNTRHSNGT
ncbi:MAG TPA: hypothetical protein VGH34_09940 [Vicinamibacterales bacterium]|jgi:hypothetical protein